MIIVLNATPLIYVTKIGFSWVFEKLGELGVKIIVPETVYQEVVTIGKEKGFSDAIIVDELVKKNVFEIKKCLTKNAVKRLLETTFGREKLIHSGEIEVLALAMELQGIAIIDEKNARKIAEAMGITVHGTMYLFIILYRHRIISKDELVAIFDELVSHGWRVSVEDYIKIKRKIELL